MTLAQPRPQPRRTVMAGSNALPFIGGLIDDLNQYRMNALAIIMFLGGVGLMVGGAILWKAFNFLGVESGVLAFDGTALIGTTTINLPLVGMTKIATIAAVAPSIIEFVFWPFSQRTWARTAMAGAALVDVGFTALYMVGAIEGLTDMPLYMQVLLVVANVGVAMAVSLGTELCVFIGLAVCWQMKGPAWAALWRGVASVITGSLHGAGAVAGFTRDAHTAAREGYHAQRHLMSRLGSPAGPTGAGRTVASHFGDDE